MSKAGTPARPSLRCAIYTRKSSEEGLDQAFNSLHAQREACEAYIKSQSHEGWKLVAAPYDDGGFSGGTMVRPGLTKFLADVDAGRVDVIVVYKVDRLTRSLADFAKIVERLDAAGASFVSVTQAFNTTNSMGRLTLNVLLSFAQFEREVTGERIRDKVAASKAKGMWMGGHVPLGYDRPVDLATRALVINDAEAELVRTIFARYLELRSVHLLCQRLSAEGLRSKLQVSSNGKTSGGLPFNRGALFHLLRNRVYIGETIHKDQHYPGAHPGIVDCDTFDAVQALLDANTRQHVARPTRVAAMPLKGRIFDADGRPMCPTFGYGRKGKVYRYYVSAPLQQGVRRTPDDDTLRRVPAEALEALIAQRLQPLVRTAMEGDLHGCFPGLLSRVEVHPTTVHLCLDQVALFGKHADHDAALERLQHSLTPGDRVATDPPNPNGLRLVLPVRMKLHGGRTWMVEPDGKPQLPASRPDPVLIRALRSAHEVAARVGLTGSRTRTGRSALRDASLGTRYERRLCALAFLAPDIQAAILAGRQPAMLNRQRLLDSDIPLGWAEQRSAFGFTVP